MKMLNESAVKVLLALLAMDEPIICQINGATRRVQAKEENHVGHYRLISLIFYEDEECWQTKEPEITICHDTQTGDYIPMSIIYQSERIISNSISFVYGSLQILNEKIQSDHAEITNDFLEKLGERPV